jgi:pyrroline-5-carboxylate reductase
MKTPRITFIGGGNMARCIIGGLVQTGFPASNIIAVDPQESICLGLAEDFAINTATTLNSGYLDTDFVILAVKPQIMQSVCQQLGKNLINPDLWIISLAAGIKIESIGKFLGEGTSQSRKIIRAMPNTPALLGLSATGLYSPETLNPDIQNEVNTIFSAIGVYEWFDSESQLDAVTALSGSGPAYFFYMMEAMINAGIKEGLSLESTTKLVVQTALGASQMAVNTLNDGAKISALRESVTSKGGTTEAGLKYLHSNNFQDIIEKAIRSARKRSVEISKNNSGK